MSVDPSGKLEPIHGACGQLDIAKDEVYRLPGGKRSQGFPGVRRLDDGKA